MLVSKSIQNIPDDSVGIYMPQSVYAETGLDRHRLHPGITADELRCCESGSTPTDETAPQLTGRTPAPDAFNVPLDSDVVLQFDEAVTLVDGLSVEIRAQGTNVAIATFNLSNPSVSYENQNSTIRLRNIPWSASTAYYVFAPAGAITDLAGNPFPGYAINAWAFTTAAS